MNVGYSAGVVAAGALAIWIAAPIHAGLVNYWSFDGDIVDTAGAFRHSTSTSVTDMEEYAFEVSSYPTHVPGPVAGTLAIQTVASRGVLITKSSLDGTADVAFAPDSTLAFWVKLPTTTAEFFTDGDRFDHLKIISWGNGSVDVQISNVPGDTGVNATVPTGEWHFITITSEDDLDLRSFYVDGELHGVGIYLESGTPVPKYLCLGVPDKATYWGQVAYARMSLWDHALTDSQVECLYECGGDPDFFCLGDGILLIVR